MAESRRQVSGESWCCMQLGQTTVQLKCKDTRKDDSIFNFSLSSFSLEALKIDHRHASGGQRWRGDSEDDVDHICRYTPG